MPDSHSGNIVLFDHDVVFTLGALAANDAIAGVTKLDGTRERGYYLHRLRILGEFVAKTSSEGPITWGIAINMSAAQVEAHVEDDPQGGILDTPTMQHPQWLLPLGMIRTSENAGPLARNQNWLDISVRRNVVEGGTLLLWAYNHQVILTSGTLLNMFIMQVGKWLND